MQNEKFTRAVEGKAIYLLILVVFMQTVYPITETNSVLALIAYQLLVAALVVVGILLAADTKRLQHVLMGLAVVWVFAGVIFAFNQEAIWAVLLTYGVLISFHSMVIWIMLRFIFQVPHVTRDVLYAASAVYLLLGAVFVSAFGLLETVTFAQTGLHAFADSRVAADAIFPWQNFVYYSYVTLTTLGYGDILPVTLWARSLVSLEAMVGVLYITIIMARLVGLYAAGDVEKVL
ncbi:MAG: potassium channel family protein [Chloroflexota bacterium]